MDTVQLRSLKQWTKRYCPRSRYVINMIDTGFKGASIVESECYSGGKEIRKPKYVQYIFFQKNWDGITIHTDKYLGEEVINKFSAGFRVAIIGEPRYLSPFAYENVEKNYEAFDLILTHDKEIIEKFPGKAKFFVSSCPALGYSKIGMHEKTELVSYMFSRKNRTAGHKYRKKLYKELKATDEFDFVYYCGSGVGAYVPEKGPTITPYMFSIAIENGWRDYNFTEKIMDCFATGTIPIYKGCPSILDFFDERGIILFEEKEELKDILRGLTPGKYNKMLRYAHINFEKVKQYSDPDDLAFKIMQEHMKEINHSFKVIR